MKPSSKGKTRIDLILVERGLAESRTKAQAMILAGEVYLPWGRVVKPSERVDRDVEVLIKPISERWVSRGALKLLGAIEDLGLDVRGNTAVDVGASTGGFTQVLLKKGAKKVFAVDVTISQLHERVASDPRVHPIELNARYLSPEHLGGELVDLAVIDCSFISLRLLLGPVKSVVRAGGWILAMVKPQFEVGPKALKGGVVRKEADRKAAIEGIKAFGSSLGLEVIGEAPSRTPGPKGNMEHFLLFRVPLRTLEEER